MDLGSECIDSAKHRVSFAVVQETLRCCAPFSDYMERYTRLSQCLSGLQPDG